jgi:RNA polymerase sigma-70 factor (ECF subfamily)
MLKDRRQVRKNRMLSAKQLEAERRLVQSSKRNPRRFSELYDRYFDRIYAFALTRTGNRAAAEDVTADTFRQAFENLTRFQWRGVPFSAWLFRIAANAASDYYQRASREQALPEAALESDVSWEHRLIEVETRAQLLELVRRLPKVQRRVIVMRFGDELSISEVAQAMGKSEGAVKALQHRAMETLRAWVGDSHD